MKSSKAPIGASFIVVSSFFYASYGIWTKLMGDYFDGFTATIFRSILVVLILLPIAFAFGKFEPLNIKKNWPYLLGIFIASTTIWGPLYYAILHAGVGLGLAVAYASTVIGMFFFGRILGSEKITRIKAISASLGIAGLSLIFIPNFTDWGWTALAAALVSGLSIAATNVLAQRIHYESTQSTIILWTVGIFSNFAMAILLSSPLPDISLDIEWVYLVIFSATSVVASWTFIKGLKLIDAGTASILGLLEIVFGVLFGVLFFHERPSVIALLGMTVIVIAAAIPYLQTRVVKQ
jgi:drug/metabolite transporter (DMT)-like permease